MMKTYRILLGILLLGAMSSCAAWKNTLSSNGGVNEVVHNVITDFVNTSNLYKADSIFELIISDKGGYYIIGIGGVVNKIYPRTKDLIGTYDELIPNTYAIYDGKLFYWNNPAEIISEEILNVLSQYDQIDINWRDTYYDIPPMIFDDGKQGVVYYVCKSDFTKYKKTRSNTINKHYRVPKLRCR